MLSISRTLPCPRIVQTCPIRLKRRSICPWTKSMAVFTERPSNISNYISGRVSTLYLLQCTFSISLEAYIVRDPP